MGNAQNTHLERHGSRASSTTDISGLGSNRNSRALDNVSLMSVDAILTSYERRAIGELEAQAEANYSAHTNPGPAQPTTDLDSPERKDSQAGASLSSFSDTEPLEYSPTYDEEAARWQEWTAEDEDDDDIGIAHHSENESNGIVANAPEEPNEHTLGHVEINEHNEPQNVKHSINESGDKNITVQKHSPPTSSTEELDYHSAVQSSGEEMDLTPSNSTKTDQPNINDSGDKKTDINQSGLIEIEESIGSVDAQPDPLVSDSDGVEAKDSVDGQHDSEPNTDDSEDEVFSGSTTDTPIGTPLVRSRPVSIDDLLDCLQETAVDEMEQAREAHEKSAKHEDSDSPIESRSPSPPAVLTPKSVGQTGDFSQQDDSEVRYVSTEDYSHFQEISRSEPRSEPVTDLDDDSDDDDFQQSLYKDLESTDPEKSAARDELSKILMQMQTEFCLKDNEEEDSDDSHTKERKISQESVSSGGEYDTSTMKIKKDTMSDSDSSDDESSDSEDEKNDIPEKDYSSSSEDEIIQHITPELIEKVINADDTKVDIFAECKAIEEEIITVENETITTEINNTDCNPESEISKSISDTQDKGTEVMTELDEDNEKEQDVVGAKFETETEAIDDEVDKELMLTSAIASSDSLEVEQIEKQVAKSSEDTQVTETVTNQELIFDQKITLEVEDIETKELSDSECMQSGETVDVEVIEPLNSQILQAEPKSGAHVSEELQEHAEGSVSDTKSSSELVSHADEASVDHSTDADLIPSAETNVESTMVDSLALSSVDIVDNSQEAEGDKIALMVDTLVANSIEAAYEMIDTAKDPSVMKGESAVAENITSGKVQDHQKVGDQHMEVPGNGTPNEEGFALPDVPMVKCDAVSSSEALYNDNDDDEDIITVRVSKTQVSDASFNEEITGAKHVSTDEEVIAEEVLELEATQSNISKEGDIEVPLIEPKVDDSATLMTSKDIVNETTTSSDETEKTIHEDVTQESDIQVKQANIEEHIQDVVSEDPQNLKGIVPRLKDLAGDVCDKTDKDREKKDVEKEVLEDKFIEEVEVDKLEKVQDQNKEEDSDKVAEVKDMGIVMAEVTFTQEQFVLESVTDVAENKEEIVNGEVTLSSDVPAGDRKLDVIVEEDQADDGKSEIPPPLPDTPPPNMPPRPSSPLLEALALPSKEEPPAEAPPLPSSSPPDAAKTQEKTITRHVPQLPEHIGYSRQLLRVIAKKYPFKPMPKEPEAQNRYRQMMRQIESEIQNMIHAPEDIRLKRERASYRERKPSVPPPNKLTMQTPVPPPSAQAARRAPPHPAMVPTKSEPRKELSRKELKRRESESRKSKKLKKKDKENESRMAQFAQFMKLGSLSKEHGKTDTKKEEKEDKVPPQPMADHSAPATAPAMGHMVQRSVIIHRDERGYGLTVSGDNPVFVQCVKENGAAARVGVQEGDRIFKVNGTLVTSSNHVEVVKLIKSGPYVALTLLGRPPGPKGGASDAGQPPGGGGPSSPPQQMDAGSDRITGPQPVNDTMNMELQNQKVSLTRIMYEKAMSQLENMKADRSLTEAELNDQLRTVRRLESALYDLTGIPAESHLPGGPRQRKSDSGPDVTYGDDVPRRDVTVTRTLSDSRKRTPHGGQEASEFSQDKNKAELNARRRRMMRKTASLPSSVTEPGDPLPHSPSPAKDESGPLSDSADDYGDSAHYEDGGPPIIPMMHSGSEGGPYSPNQIIMGAEDDFSSGEEGQLEEHGPFSDLNALKRRPSHLAVFLNYLISNSDPSPLLFYLVTEDYAKGTIKEMKKWVYEIHSTFLVNKAPLRVNVDESIVSNIDNTLLTKSDKIDAIQSAFGLARHHAQNEISELLADFRNKCALGLGSLYGTHEISTKETMERSKELHLVEKYLVPHFERLLENEEASDRNQAMAYALATVLKQVGCTMSGKTGAALDRCPSYVAKDTKMFKLKTKKRQINVRDHSFTPNTYYATTLCHHCSGILWGIGIQGYQCQVCEMNVHKQCVEAVKESCSAGHKDRKKTKRTSSIMNIIRKPSSVTQPQISKESRWSDDGYTSPGSSSTFLRLPKDDNDDDESDRLHVTRPVSQMIEQLSPRLIEESRSPSSPPRPCSPEPGPEGDAENRKHVVRSESLKGKQEAKSKTVRRSQSDLHVDDPNVKTVLNQSGSDTSIAGSLESPSNSNELLNIRGDSSWTKTVHEERYDDSDLEVENALPPLNASIPPDAFKKLKPKEKKRQDVLNELFHTERTHMRTLKVMHKVFYTNMANGLSVDLARLLFPNLEELIQLHSCLNNSFKARKKDDPVISHVGDLLLNRFSGEEGDKFKEACATHCRSQSYALETLRVRQRKDQKLAMFLQEASLNPLCRRLELKDLIPTVMQRLTKYPLLIESLLKYTQVGTEEHTQLRTALNCTRDILSYVNEAVKEFEYHQKLVEIQKRLDKRSFENSNLPMVAEYKNLDLTQHKMVYNGPLTWRIGRSKQIELHVVLLESMLVLLQKQDDKYVLKCSTTVVSGQEDSKYTHSPVLKLSTVLARNVAVDKRAFFLVCTSDIGPQIYELHAMSTEEKNKWLRYIADAVDAYKERTQGKQPNKVPAPSSQDNKQHAHIRKESKEEPVEAEGLEQYRSSSVDSLDKVTLHTANQTELIQPTEVVISDTVLEEAEPVLSAREKLKRKDAVVRQTLEEKDHLIAEILNVPSADFANIAEMASDIEGEKDVRELVLGASYQVSRLTQIVNDSLTVPAEDESADEPLSPPAASAGKVDDKPTVMVTLGTNAILDITKKLNDQLSVLLGIVGEHEEHNKRLQRDLDVANEQLALARDVTHRSPSNSLSRHSRPNSFASITSSTSEVAETPDEVQQMASSTEDTGLFPSSTSPQDVAVTNVYDVMKLEVVESEDANHNVHQSDQSQSTDTLSTLPPTTSSLTDANLNASPPDEETPPTT